MRYLLDSAINPFEQLCSEMSVDDDTVLCKEISEIRKHVYDKSESSSQFLKYGDEKEEIYVQKNS